MNNLKLGDKLICINTIYNGLNDILFEKDVIYTIIGVDAFVEGYDFEYQLNHNLYANEYAFFTKSYIMRKFILC